MPLINVIVIALATLCAILGPDEKGVDRNRGEAAIVAGG